MNADTVAVGRGVVIVIAEFESSVNGYVMRKKLRIPQTTTTPISGLDLWTQLQANVVHPLHGGDDNDNDEDLDWEIYDPSTREYIDLRQILSSTEEEDIQERFGSRIRVVAKRRQQQSATVASNHQSLRAIGGRYFEFNESIQVAGNTTLRIHQDANQPYAGTAGTVWDGSILLTHYLNEHVSSAALHLPPRRQQQQHIDGDDGTNAEFSGGSGGMVVLELGAGCGLAGIATAILVSADRLVLSDLPECVPRLERNVQLNRQALQQHGVQQVLCRACDWYHPPDLNHLLNDNQEVGEQVDSVPMVDIIVAADCVWMEELVEPLFSTLEKYVTAGHTLVFICYQRRGKSTDEAFWKALYRTFDTVDELHHLPYGTPSVFHLFSCRKSR